MAAASRGQESKDGELKGGGAMDPLYPNEESERREYSHVVCMITGQYAARNSGVD
jgi:hypothetical protein